MRQVAATLGVLLLAFGFAIGHYPVLINPGWNEVLKCSAETVGAVLTLAFMSVRGHWNLHRMISLATSGWLAYYALYGDLKQRHPVITLSMMAFVIWGLTFALFPPIRVRKVVGTAFLIALWCFVLAGILSAFLQHKVLEAWLVIGIFVPMLGVATYSAWASVLAMNGGYRGWGTFYLNVGGLPLVDPLVSETREVATSERVL